MSAIQITLLLAYAVGMSLGQFLFKLAAVSLSPYKGAAPTIGERLFQLGLNPYFVAAILMYAGLSVLWVWILTFTPLSRAYPFVALTIIITPLVSHFLFVEPLGVKFFIGLSFVAVGLVLVSSD